MESPEPDASPSASLANDSERPSSGSRSRFNRYREKVRQRELPASGSFHGPHDSRPARPRVRTARQLVWEFLRLLRPFRLQLFWILTSATAATLIGLLPPAGTKFIIDYGLSGKSLPQPWLDRFPQLADPRRLLLATVVAVAVSRIAAQCCARRCACTLRHQGRGPALHRSRRRERSRAARCIARCAA